jgi:hypothetical protein
MQLGSIVYNSNAANTLGAGAANSGLSVTGGVVQLGQLTNQAGNPGILLRDTEVPMGNFPLRFTGMGGIATQGIYFKADAAKAITTPYLIFQDSTGAENGRVNFQNGDIAIGVNAGIAITIATLNQTAIGAHCLGLNQTGIRNTGLGNGVLSLCVSSPANTGVGYAALNNLASGAGFNTAVGYQALYQCVTGANNTAVGLFAGAGTYLGSSDNTLIGQNAGARTTAAGTAVFQGTIIGSNAGSLLATWGVGVIAIGYSAMVNGVLGANSIIIGSNSDSSGGNPANSTIIGQGMDIQISNVVVLGRGDQNIIIGQTVSAAGSDNGSKLQVKGSISLPQTVQAGNYTVTASDYAVIFTATATATIPTAASSLNKIYCIVAAGAAVTVTTSINYNNLSNTSVNTIGPTLSAMIQSDGTTWRQIK